MKLLLISQYFPPETGAGAIRSESLVKYLSKLGWDINVISEIPNYPTGKINTTIHQNEDYYGAKIHRVWVWANPRQNTIQQLGLFSSFLISSVLYALRYPKKYDIVYATSPPIFAGIAGAVISKFLGSKFVLDIRDIWPDAAVDSGNIEKSSLFFKIGRFIERTLYKQADYIIPVTSNSEKIIASRAGDTPTQVITNGVDLETFYYRPNFDEIIDEKYDPDKFRVGYVGSLGVIHDIRSIIKAAKMCEDLPDIEFVIVGDGGSRDKLINALNEFDPQNLRWVGLKEHYKIPAYISSFDVAINPVYNAEIFESIITVKFFEYLACETPVISLARGLMKEEGDRSGAVITLTPEKPKLLAEKIKELKSNPDKLRKLSENARSFIVNNYSRKEQTQKLSKTLMKLLTNQD